MFTHADFRAELLREFPSIRKSVESSDGHQYIEMAAFAQFTQRAKGAADWDTYERAVKLAARFIDSADKDLNNELYVSFLEHLDFEGPRGPTAWRLLPINLQRAWHRIIASNERLTGKAWVKTKPAISD